MKYYHITKNNNRVLNSITQNGLLCDSEGNIFVFEDRAIGFNEIINDVADIIAHNQLFLKEYIMFEIDSAGFEVDLINDNVAEIGANFQWIVKQPKIKTEYISFCGKYKTIFKSFF